MTDGTAAHEKVRFSAMVSGAVQGVGYRRFVSRNATDLGVTGHAENLADGRVEVVAEGYRVDLDVLLVRMRTGPAHSTVTAIEVDWSEASGMEGFYVY